MCGVLRLRYSALRFAKFEKAQAPNLIWLNTVILINKMICTFLISPLSPHPSVLSVITLCQPCSSLCTFLLTAHVATAHCSLFLGSDHTSKLHTAHCSCSKSPLHTAHCLCAQITPANCSLLTHVLRSHLQIAPCSLLMCSDHTSKFHTSHCSCAQITPANCSLLTPHVLRSHKQIAHCSLLISLFPLIRTSTLLPACSHIPYCDMYK